MKRYYLLAVVLIFVMLFSVIGCEEPVEEEPVEEEVFPDPDEEFRLIIVYGPGGATDIQGRILAPYLEEELGISVVVENIEGGGGIVGLETGLLAPADGYTAMAYAVPGHDAQIVVPSEHGGADVDFESEDFISLAAATSDPHVLVTGGESEYQTVEELVEYAKENPGELEFGGTDPFPGFSSLVHYNVEKETGAEFEFIPYAEGASAIHAELMGLHLPVGSVGLGGVVDYIEDGELTGLAVAARERDERAPNVPTWKETLGIDEMVASTRGYVVNAETPDHKVEVLQEAFYNAVTNPEFIEEFEDAGQASVPFNHEEMQEARDSGAAMAREILEELQEQ